MLVIFFENVDFQKFTIYYLKMFNSNLKYVYLGICGVYLSCRVKNLNSMYSKLYRFMDKNDGQFPINKCLNDLLGIRFIIDDDFDYDLLISMVREKFSDFKFINSSKNGYFAYHLYLKVDNFSFPFEVQFWKKSDEEKNKQMHREYKQSYVDVESRIVEKEVEDDV